MKELINKLELKQVKLIMILFCALGDALIFSYIYIKFNNFAWYRDIMDEVMRSNGMDPQEIDLNMLQEYFALMQNALVFMIILLIGFQILHYLIFFAEKKYGKQYVKLIGYLGAPCFFLASLTMLSTPLWASLFFIQALLYTFVALNIKRLG